MQVTYHAEDYEDEEVLVAEMSDANGGGYGEPATCEHDGGAAKSNTLRSHVGGEDLGDKDKFCRLIHGEDEDKDKDHSRQRLQTCKSARSSRAVIGSVKAYNDSHNAASGRRLGENEGPPSDLVQPGGPEDVREECSHEPTSLQKKGRNTSEAQGGEKHTVVVCTELDARGLVAGSDHDSCSGALPVRGEHGDPGTRQRAIDGGLRADLEMLFAGNYILGIIRRMVDVL